MQAADNSELSGLSPSYRQQLEEGDKLIIMQMTVEVEDDPMDKIPLLYRQYIKVFSEKASHEFLLSRIWDHVIELKPNAPTTLPSKIYPLSQAELQELEKFVTEHLKRSTIRPSKSPYAALFFFIKKKNGKLRPVHDYQPINEWTIKNKYPLPLIPQLIDHLQNCSLFTKFDIRWGYNNVRIKDGDQ